MKRKIITFLMAFSLAFSSGGLLFAEDDSSGDLSTPEVVGDVLWVRPLGIMQIAMGATGPSSFPFL